MRFSLGQFSKCCAKFWAGSGSKAGEGIPRTPSFSFGFEGLVVVRVVWFEDRPVVVREVMDLGG
jgi:hypothetical protein